MVAYIGSIYGPGIFLWLARYYQPVLDALIVLAVAGGQIR